MECTMPKKAAKSRTTPASEPDQKFIAKTERLAALWEKDASRETPPMGDEQFEAIKLEFAIATSPVTTLAGFKAKCKAIEACQWDADDLVIIACLVGRDIERLGIKKIPDFIRKRHGEVWPGSMRDRVDGFAAAYAENLVVASAT
jgi:hypothetical protein